MQKLLSDKRQDKQNRSFIIMTDLSTIYSGKMMAYCPECDSQRMFVIVVTTKSTKLDCPVCHKIYFYRIVKLVNSTFIDQ